MYKFISKTPPDPSSCLSKVTHFGPKNVHGFHFETPKHQFAKWFLFHTLGGGVAIFWAYHRDHLGPFGCKGQSGTNKADKKKSNSKQFRETRHLAKQSVGIIQWMCILQNLLAGLKRRLGGPDFSQTFRGKIRKRE